MKLLRLKHLQISALIALSAVTLFFIYFTLLPAVFPLSREAALSSYEQSYRLYDSDGNLFRERINSRGQRAIWLDLKDTEPFFLDALVAAEDWNFYSHRGLDVNALFRAAWNNTFTSGIQSGASTLSMQLGRIVRGNSRTVLGKIAQIFTARRIEFGMTKEEILELYINMVPLGRGNTGLQAAAWEYFGVSQNLLSRSQLALLAGIIQAPSLYNPARNPLGAKMRRSYVIQRMHSLGLISSDEQDAMSNEPILVSSGHFAPQAMHFGDFVLSKQPRPGRVDTSLNLELTTAIERLIGGYVDRMHHAGIEHAAAVVIDNNSLEIVAMVGSPDYWDGKQGSNNGATALRQPGSTLKPFTYAIAFEAGRQPGDIIPDIPIKYIGSEGKLYEPQNITRTYSGPVLIQDALIRSLNIPAIQMANYVGLENLLDRLRLLGFKDLEEDPGFYGLGLTLGSGEVSLLQLVSAYTVFPGKGIYSPATWEAGGNRDRDLTDTNVRIFDEESAYLITDILSNDRLKIRAFGTNNPLLFPFPISIKTGTSNNWKDNWTVGFTSQYTVGVWAGAFSGRPNNQYSATHGVGPLFHRVATLVNTYYPKPAPPIWDVVPPSISYEEVCNVSGQRPTRHCPSTSWTLVNSNHTPLSDGDTCTVHVPVKFDTRSGLAVSAEATGSHIITRVLEYLPPEYAEWEAESGRVRPPVLEKLVDVATASDSLRITSPRDGDVFVFEPGYNPDTQSIELSVKTDETVTSVRWFVNGELLAEVQWPYIASLPITAGEYTIEARSADKTSEAVNLIIR